jgi:hypothetical protein
MRSKVYYSETEARNLAFIYESILRGMKGR